MVDRERDEVMGGVKAMGNYCIDIFSQGIIQAKYEYSLAHRFHFIMSYVGSVCNLYIFIYCGGRLQQAAGIT